MHEPRHGEATSHRPYSWLKDRDDPATREYLEAENAWTRAQLARLAPLRDELYDEIVAHVQEDDVSAPVVRDGWAYARRTTQGSEQVAHLRWPVAPGEVPDSAPDDAAVILDENVLADATGYVDLGALAVSPDHRLLAYAVDVDGDERFTLRVRDLTTGDDLPDEVGPDHGRPLGHGVAWGSDSAHLYYTVLDAAHRPHEVWRHVVGTPAAADELVLTDRDERFWLGVTRTRSGRFVVLSAGSSTTDEVHLLDAEDPEATPLPVAPRQDGVEYDVDHRGDHLLVVTNADGADDFALLRAPLGPVLAGDGDRSTWVEVVPHRPGTRLLRAAAFADHVALVERAEGLPRVRVLLPGDARDRLIDAGDAATVRLGPNPTYDTTRLRIVTTSLVTPVETLDVDLPTGSRRLVKRQPVPGYDPDRFVTTRTWASAPDGERVPVTLAHRADLELPAPGLLYVYGAYEATVDPSFSPTRLGLLERGVAYAIAHVRGGGALGRRWYEAGRRADKPATFTDTLACAQHLVDTGIVAGDRLALRGASAGGLSVGAALDLAPERFAAAVLEVPFVDVRSTMWDASLPLTVIEYDEWGDPTTDPEVDERIRGYTPTENVDADAAYPPLLVTAGINDPRVGYWEPATYVAEHRHLRGPDAPVLLRTELGAGHFGPSGRYGAWREEAENLAFVLDALGVA